MDPWVMRTLPEAIAARRAQPPGLPKLLLLWSDFDVLVPPEHGPRSQALLPEAKLEWLTGTSHFMHVDTPEPTVRALLEFGAEPSQP